LFTGIVEDIGTLSRIEKRPAGLALGIRCALELSSVEAGDSLAVDGVCLTVTRKNQGELEFDVSQETVSATTLGQLRQGDRVHLERALALGARLGGHLVTGHVDGVGQILDRTPRGQNLDLTVLAPPEVSPFLVPKGSVAISGVSLTINEPRGDRFRVTLVPHTLLKTRLAGLKPGDPLNLEADIIGKYVRHWMQGGSGSRIDTDFLAEHGFLPGGDPGGRE